MKRYSIIGALILIPGGICALCCAQSNLWNGTWKLNESKTAVPGPDFVVTPKPMGEYQIQTGTSTFVYRCDGKEYPTVEFIYVKCVRETAAQMDLLYKKNGKPYSKVHRELSEDGKTLTSTAIIFHQDGEQETKVTVFSRYTASTGFAGGWRDTAPHLPTLLITTLNNAHFRLAFPQEEQYTDMKLDGTDAMVHARGSDITGATLSIRPDGPLKFLTTSKRHNVLVNEGSLSLSSDGNTLIEQWWKPAYPSQKGTKVYSRQ